MLHLRLIYGMDLLEDDDDKAFTAILPMCERAVLFEVMVKLPYLPCRLCIYELHYDPRWCYEVKGIFKNYQSTQMTKNKTAFACLHFHLNTLCVSIFVVIVMTFMRRVNEILTYLSCYSFVCCYFCRLNKESCVTAQLET